MYSREVKYLKYLRVLEQYCILTHLDVLEICGREIGLSLLACGTPETTGLGVAICGEDCLIDVLFYRVNLCNIIFLIKRRLTCKYFGRHFLHICEIVDQYGRGLGSGLEKRDLILVKCFENILTRGGKHSLTSSRLLQALLNSVRMRSTVVWRQLTELVARTRQEQPHDKKKRKNTKKPEKE